MEHQITPRDKPNAPPNGRIKLLVAVGSGGHATELLYLVDKLSTQYQFHYLICRDDNLSAERIRQPGPLYRVTRPRSMQSGALDAALRTFVAAFESLWVLARVRPTAILSARPANPLPL